MLRVGGDCRGSSVASRRGGRDAGALARRVGACRWRSAGRGAGGAERDAGRDHRDRPRPGARPASAAPSAAGSRSPRRSGWSPARASPPRRAASRRATSTTAGVLVVTSLPYLLDSRDIALAPEDREPFDLGQFVRSFWVSPRQHPDFAWAWITRFLMNLGNALLLLYLLYYLKDAVDLTDEEAEHGVLLLTGGVRRLHGPHGRRRRHLVGPAGSPQGLRDRLGAGRGRRAAADRVRDHLGRGVRRSGASSASASASTPPSTSR